MRLTDRNNTSVGFHAEQVFKRSTILRMMLVLALLMFGLLQAPVAKPGQDDVRKTLERLETEWNVAHVRGDAAALDRIFGDDNVGIVVDDLTATIDFFRELGLELEGRDSIEGEWAGRVTGLGDQRVDIAMMRTPDGHGRLELSRFIAPPVGRSLAAAEF